MSDSPVSESPVSGVGPASAGGRRVAPWIAGAVAIVLAALFVMLLVNRGTTGDSADSPLLANPAPEVHGTLADGTPFELSRRKGSWVVLNFFSHDCVPCIVEHPALIEFVEEQRALGTRGAEFYTIVQDSTREQVADFFAERGGDWPIVFDDEFLFQVEFGVAQVPETWVIDPNGTVRARYLSTVAADRLSSDLEAMQAGLL